MLARWSRRSSSGADATSPPDYPEGRINTGVNAFPSSMRKTTSGVLLATVTAVIWGGQFVVGKSALARVDAFPLTTVRYALASLLLLGLLVAVEGWSALRLEGRGKRLFVLGSLGFAGFNLFAYTGLQHARPQSASL